MLKNSLSTLVILTQIAVFISLTAFSTQISDADFTAYDMINSVNIIRAAKGLPPVQMHPLIMAVAQDHSEYQASMSRSSHSGRDGGIVNGRVEASGYAGGRKFVAGENVATLSIGITGMLPIIVNEIWSDPGHYGAMVNPKYTDAGVGIASDGEMVYVTLNLAGIVEEASQGTTPEADDNDQPVTNQEILPLITTTPKSDGAVYHTVGFGQTLGTIAQMYGVDMNDLAAINGIEPDTIYAGQNLFIRFMTPSPVTEIPNPGTSQTVTTTPLLTTVSPIPSTLIVDSTPIPATKPVSRPREIGIVVIFVLFSILIVIFLYSRKPG